MEESIMEEPIRRASSSQAYGKRAFSKTGCFISISYKFFTWVYQ